MLGATATMWDVLSWGGETQALIYNPNTGKEPWQESEPVAALQTVWHNAQHPSRLTLPVIPA